MHFIQQENFIMSSISGLLNPLKWWKAYQFHQKNKVFDKSSYDLELYLYSQILSNDMLHYGYFKDKDIPADQISFALLEQAQMDYAEKIIASINNKELPVLDVGCGMGGLSNMLQKRGFQVDALTPNANQKAHIDQKYPEITCHQLKFEDFQSNASFGTIINSESLQYIDLKTAFEKVDKLLTSGGRWIVVDYFREHQEGINKSGHLLSDFLGLIDEYGWKVDHREDITENVLPTIKFANMFAERFLVPVKHFALEKLRYKKAWLYFMAQDFREKVDEKVTKEKASIDPEMFLKEKKYLFFAIDKKG